MSPIHIRDEIRQRRPFRSLGHQAVVALLRTADVVRQSYGVVVEPHGLTLQQYNVLRILRGAAGEGLPTLEIVERMVERAPGITRLLDRLERKGLVRRQRCAVDRRQVLCWPTAAALELLAALDSPVDAADHGAVAALSQRARRELVRLLDAVRGGLQEPIQPQSGARPRASAATKGA